MPTEREQWKGHEIVVDEDAEQRLTIDGKPVETFEVNGGGYIAAGFAFDPQPTLTDLAKALVDAREG